MFCYVHKTHSVSQVAIEPSPLCRHLIAMLLNLGAFVAAPNLSILLTFEYFLQVIQILPFKFSQNYTYHIHVYNFILHLGHKLWLWLRSSECEFALPGTCRCIQSTCPMMWTLITISSGEAVEIFKWGKTFPRPNSLLIFCPIISNVPMFPMLTIRNLKKKNKIKISALSLRLLSFNYLFRPPVFLNCLKEFLQENQVFNFATQTQSDLQQRHRQSVLFMHGTSSLHASASWLSNESWTSAFVVDWGRWNVVVWFVRFWLLFVPTFFSRSSLSFSLSPISISIS